MPANLPPQYFETERKLKTAKTSPEKIAILEELLAIVPKHKGTEKLQALLKTKIAKLKSQAQKKPAVARHALTFHIEKAGAGQVVLIGPPNSGKSSLIQALTNARPEIGDYPFTTHTPAPAMMAYQNIQIQLIDTPPITRDYMEPWHSELIKGSDGVLIILDLGSLDPAGDYRVLVDKLKERRLELVPECQDISHEGQMFQKEALILANKADLSLGGPMLSSLSRVIPPSFDLLVISARRGDNLELLKNRIFTLIRVLRVYSKIPGKKADLNEPFIFKRGNTLMDMARAVHKDFAQKLRFARIWGKEKYQGQKVNRDYILQDEDVIELHM